MHIRSLLLLLVCIHAALLSYCAYSFSPTADEPGHLVAGISHWRLQRFELFCATPPLVRLVAALPVMPLADEPQWRDVSMSFRDKTHTYVGQGFVSANGERFFWLMTVARLACIPFSVLGMLVCFCWGRDLFGPRAGLLAATLWCFDPNLVAHGSLITPDVAGTSLGCLACYRFWRWLRSPTWTQSAVTGVVLGLAELATTSLIVLYPLWVIAWIAYRFGDRALMRAADWLRELTMLTACLVGGVYVLNIGYGFDGSMQPLEHFRFSSSIGTGKTTTEPGNRFQGSWIGSLPVPVPASYLLGIDQQQSDLEDYDKPSYLAGSWKKTGWWYYYLYALAIKVPLGTIAMIVGAFGIRVFRPGIASFRDEIVLLMTPAMILTIASIQSGFSEHMRYAIPVLPFLFIWASQVACPVSRRQGSGRGICLEGTTQTRVVASMVIWSVASSMCVYPHVLSYFNEICGGPRHGHRYLLGSNVDWGQDLGRLKSYLRDNQNKGRCFLACEGTVYPEDLGIAYAIPRSAPDSRSTRDLPSGVYAISVTYLHGMPFLKRVKSADSNVAEVRTFDGLLDREPTTMCGYSLYLFEIE